MCSTICKLYLLIIIGPVILYDAYFSETDGPMLMNNVHCNGWENSIFDCDNQIYPNINWCAPQWSMGVICKDGKHGKNYNIKRALTVFSINEMYLQ